MKYTTPDKVVKQTEKCAKIYKNDGYRYGDSKSLPPCVGDHTTSCERGAFSLPYWDLGFTDQPAGGVTVLNIEKYATKWGCTKITDPKDLKRGDAVLMKKVGTSTPTAEWHLFMMTDYDPKTGRCSKYDFGSQARINAGGFSQNVPLNEWPGQKEFYCAFRCPEKKKRHKYTATIYNVQLGNKGDSVELMTSLLRARGYKTDGELIKVTREADEKVIAVLKRFQEKNGLKASGVCGAKTWEKLMCTISVKRVK